MSPRDRFPSIVPQDPSLGPPRLLRLLLGRGLERSQDEDGRGADDHDDLEAHDAEPQAVEELLLAAPEEAVDLLDEEGVRAGHEEEQLRDVEEIPVGPARGDVSRLVFFIRVPGRGGEYSLCLRSQLGPFDGVVLAELRGLDREKNAAENPRPESHQAVPGGRVDVEVQEGINDFCHFERRGRAFRRGKNRIDGRCATQLATYATR